MTRFIIKRLLQAIPVIIGVTLIIFLLMFVLPGDPARMLVQKGASPEVLENIRESYGLNRPWYVQYGKYMCNLSHGDFGTSIRYRKPVLDIMKDHYPNSIRLAVVALIIEALIGIAAGVISAVKRHSFLDIWVTLSTTILVAMPVFWFAMLLQVIFGLKLGILPISGMGDGSWRYYVLPAVALASVHTAFTARVTRSSMLEVVNQNYIRTARAKGLSEIKVILKHALKNALIPVVTLLGLDLGGLIGSAILTETVFSWPGVGRVIYLAILQRDTPVIMGGTLILVLIFILLNLIVDISYAYLDPRIKFEGQKVD
ncbi:ABC transporter permease [Candidatus Oleimmundimicrobium sp.]|uniref:ABC transporter permease n=1 Tax=Candidatus Oleimmundimicrobium sp. TaxID=3060597 RepID=UPI0027177702|nr:ABC transporter permease [Candidatus Oleimmundimicrobium sp.]MDO8885288.1 ABC transporter permease [Candidatus Oleimmundimicrobium sp.]